MTFFDNNIEVLKAAKTMGAQTVLVRQPTKRHYDNVDTDHCDYIIDDIVKLSTIESFQSMLKQTKSLDIPCEDQHSSNTITRIQQLAEGVESNMNNAMQDLAQEDSQMQYAQDPTELTPLNIDEESDTPQSLSHTFITPENATTESVINQATPQSATTFSCSTITEDTSDIDSNGNSPQNLPPMCNG